MAAKKEPSEKTKKKAPKKANGEGSISRYKDGWRATVTVDRDDDGKLIRKQFYGKSKQEAIDKADELKNSSLSRYEGLLRNYIKDSALGRIKLKDLKPANIQTYYNSLIRDKDKTPDTIKSINKMLKSALNQALIEKYVISNSCNHIVLPKIREKDEVDVFTVEEQKALIKATEGHRHRALFLLDLGTGLRIGELLGLKWNDINFDRLELSVNQTIRRETKLDLKNGTKVDVGRKTALEESTPKTQYSKRTIPLIPELIKELKLHQFQQNGERVAAGDAYADNKLVFPNELGEPTDPRNLARSYKRLLNRADIPYKKFHALRHYVESDIMLSKSSFSFIYSNYTIEHSP